MSPSGIWAEPAEPSFLNAYLLNNDDNMVTDLQLLVMTELFGHPDSSTKNLHQACSVGDVTACKIAKVRIV